MAWIRPRSSSGRTSGRDKLKIRNISAVHRPMPRICVNSAITASSSIDVQLSTCSAPETKCCATSRIYSDLRFDNPHDCNFTGPTLMNCCGASVGHAPSTRFQIACAAVTEICWPTTERASVVNGSSRLIRCTGPNFGISFLRIRSRLTRSAQALSQYSGRAASADNPGVCTGTVFSAVTARDLRTISPSFCGARTSACVAPALMPVSLAFTSSTPLASPLAFFSDAFGAAARTVLRARARPFCLATPSWATPLTARFFDAVLRSPSRAAPLASFASGVDTFDVFTFARRATLLGGAAVLPDAARLASAFLAVAIMPPTWRVDQREREALKRDAIRSTHPVCLQVQYRLRAIRRESGLLRHSSLPASQQRDRQSSCLYRQA